MLNLTTLGECHRPASEGIIPGQRESILFLDKVISLYSIETKDLEKQLKDAETTEQIKSIILK